MISGFNISIKGGGVNTSSTFASKGKNMETYRVRVKTSGSKLAFRGKVIRTPVTMKNVLKSELDIIETFCRQNLLDVSVRLESDALAEEMARELKKNKPPVYKEDLDKDIPIEELKKESLSILDKLVESEGEDEETDNISGEM